MGNNLCSVSKAKRKSPVNRQCTIMAPLVANLTPLEENFLRLLFQDLACR